MSAKKPPGPRLRVARNWSDSLLKPLPKDSPDKVRACAANAVSILVQDPRWEGVLAYDEFAESIVKRKTPPWREQDQPKCEPLGDWTDEDTIRVQCWLSDRYGMDLGLEPILGAVKVVAHRSPFHPVRDWLESLRWDGKKMLPTWLIDIMGCDDTPYTRAVGQAWSVSAVARAYKPGCKVDTVLVLEGKPGIFKSSVLRALCGDEWFLEMSLTDVANKDAMQILKRKWLAEFPEIDGLSRTEQAHVKSYFSRQVDTYRPSYGKGSRDFPRQTVFAATTNKDEWLSDETGGTGRRFWPVHCTRGDVALASVAREQFWAEARARYLSGELWHITDPELRDSERSEQETRFRVDPWEQSIAAWLAKPTEVGSKAERGVTTADVLAGAIGLDVGKREMAHTMRVGAVLRRLGWVRSKHPESRDGVRVRIYRPIEGAATNGHTLVPLEVPPDAWIEPEPRTEDDFPDASEL